MLCFGDGIDLFLTGLFWKFAYVLQYFLDLMFNLIEITLKIIRFAQQPSLTNKVPDIPFQHSTVVEFPLVVNLPLSARCSRPVPSLVNSRWCPRECLAVPSVCPPVDQSCLNHAPDSNSLQPCEIHPHK